MIYKFQPFSTTKHLGREFNAHCAMVPNAEDWILILDYDCMILCPQTYHVIERAIERYPDTAIFGAMTNRVGYSFQCQSGQVDYNTNIKDHHRISQQLANEFQNGECRPARTIAGFFLLFRKSYWMESPFQADIIDGRGMFFDASFCKHAQARRLPIRIIKGAYLFHWYRFEKENYLDKSHLRK